MKIPGLSAMAALCILLLTGCGLLMKSEYQRPELTIPNDWTTKSTGSQWLRTTPHWWKIFNDPQLSQAIEEVLERNNDLAAAGIRLQQARLDSDLTDTNLTPDVTAGGSASNSKNIRRNTNSTESYAFSATLSYELDLWGKLARMREQSQWLVQATDLDRQNTALTLIGTTSQYYWQIANLNQKISNTQHSIELAQETESITASRFAAGATHKLDVLQAQQSTLDAQSNLLDLVQQREETRNALAILFNHPPSVRLPERHSLDTLQTIVLQPDIPMSVIGRRPDVQSAEWQLRAALAGSDVAALNFYPSLSLSAALGTSSNLFHQWFSDPIRSLGSSLTLPFIQWNTVQLTVERSKLDVQQAAITFRSKVYAALSDVDKALSHRATREQQRQDVITSQQLSRERLVLAKSQYLAGSVSIQTWLDAQDNQLSVENQLSDIQYDYLNDNMQLWLAMGGEPIPEPQLNQGKPDAK